MPNRLALRVAVILLTLPVIAAGQSNRTATVRGTPARPGSVLEITLHGVDGDRDPQGTAFGRTLVFVPTGVPHTWRALAGVDVSQPPGVGTFRIDVATGHARELSLSGTISVAASTYPTRRLRVATQFVDPSPEQLERIRRDSERLEAIFAAVTIPERFEWFALPLPGVPGSNFGTRSIFNGEPRAPHAGTDFRGAAGTPIAAPAAGRVVLAEDLFFTGQTVVIDHGLGVYSLLAHLSRIDVAPGRQLARGETVGLLGATGRVTGPHLHWTVRLNGARVDPLRLVALLAPARAGADGGAAAGRAPN